MSLSQPADQLSLPGTNKRQNKSPVAEEPTGKSLTARQKRQRTRSQRLFEMDGIDNKLDALIDTMNTLSQRSDSSEKKLDALLVKIENTDVNINILVQEISTVKHKTEVLEKTQENFRDDINWLKNEVGRLSVDLGAVQQTTLSNHFLIFGLPHDLAVDKPFMWLNKIASKLGVVICEQDLKHVALRKNEKYKNSYLTGIFHDIRLRQQLFEQAKISRPLVVESVFTSLPGNSPLRGKEISLKGHVAPAIRSRLSEAHRLNNNVFKFIWQKDGRLLMKKDVGHQVYEIKSTDQLNEVLTKNPIPHAQLSRNQQQTYRSQSSSQNVSMDTSPTNAPHLHQSASKSK